MNNLDKIYNNLGLDAVAFSKGYVDYLATLLQQLDHKKVAACIEQMEQAKENHNTIFVIGNGGSASTASHVATDIGLAVLKKSIKEPKHSYRAMSFTDNFALVSAVGNDSAFENIFLDQIKVHFRPGDKLVVISASGNSPNIVAAAEWFKKQGGTVMGWLGFDGGKLNDIVDIPVLVKSPKGEYAPVEDLHLIINHIIVTWMQYNIMHLEGTISR